MSSPWKKKGLPRIKEKEKEYDFKTFYDDSRELANRISEIVSGKPTPCVLNALSQVTGVVIALCAEDYNHLHEGIEAITEMIKQRTITQWDQRSKK